MKCSISLPEVQRFVYDKTTLREVICQLRFTPILKISTEPPADFQEEIRNVFPLFSEKSPIEIEGMPDFMRQAIPQTFPKAYNFTSEDGLTTISLTQDYIALSTQNYLRFENFLEKMNLTLNAIHKTYNPSFFVRTGLRYIDIIKRSSLDLLDFHWSDLLNQNIAGELAGDLSECVIGSKSNNLYKFCDFKLRCQHGIIKMKGEEEECYTLDNDFFTEDRKTKGEIIDILKCFIGSERRFLRYAISERLHNAMEPRTP